jgi:hypothetical protein
MSNLEYLAHRRRATWVAQLWITLQKVRQSFLAWIGATIAFGSQVKKAMEHVLGFDRIGLCAARHGDRPALVEDKPRRCLPGLCLFPFSGG